MRDQRQRLQRLAQPHVVGEDAAELVLPQEREPLESLDLVRPQLRGQPGGQRHAAEVSHRLQWRCIRPGAGERQEAIDLSLPGACLAADQAKLGQLGPQASLESADPQRLRRPVLERPRLLDEPGERLKSRLVQREVGTVVEQQVLIAPRQRQEQVSEQDELILDEDHDAKTEPVVVAGQLLRGELDPQRVAGLAIIGRSAADLYFDAGPASQHRQGLRAESHGLESGELSRSQGGGRHVELGQDGPLSVDVPVWLGVGLGAMPGGGDGAAGDVRRRVAGSGQRPSRADRRSQLRVADLVSPLPANRQLVSRTVRGAEHQRRR